MKEGSAIDFSQTAPRWTWRAVVLAVLFTGLLYVLLPMSEQFSSRPEMDVRVRDVETVSIPPPLQAPPPPETESLPSVALEVSLPVPVMNQRPQETYVLKLPVEVEPHFAGLKEVAQTQFEIGGEELSAGLVSGVFEISDLDRAPRPLVQVNPIYPPRARMRKIEGYVTVEFVVKTDGEVEDLQVTASEPGDLFVKAVEQAVRGWRFTPGEIRGESVSSRVRQRIDFTLDP